MIIIILAFLNEETLVWSYGHHFVVVLLGRLVVVMQSLWSCRSVLTTLIHPFKLNEHVMLDTFDIQR